MKVFNKDGKELDFRQIKRFKKEFYDKKRAISFIKFYQELHPELKFTLE